MSKLYFQQRTLARVTILSLMLRSLVADIIVLLLELMDWKIGGIFFVVLTPAEIPSDSAPKVLVTSISGPTLKSFCLSSVLVIEENNSWVVFIKSDWISRSHPVASSATVFWKKTPLALSYSSSKIWPLKPGSPFANGSPRTGLYPRKPWPIFGNLSPSLHPPRLFSHPQKFLLLRFRIFLSAFLSEKWFFDSP